MDAETARKSLEALMATSSNAGSASLSPMDEWKKTMVNDFFDKYKKYLSK